LVYDAQNYWVFELYPSSGILEGWKHCFGDSICVHPKVEEQTPTLLGP
jgi:hypothetical protein